MRIWLAIACGGAIGALFRYGLSGLVAGVAKAGFPWGTLAVNILGSFLIGGIWEVFDRMSVSAAWRALVVVGGLGAFTTFSTYSLEVLTLGRVQDYRTAALYIVSSNLLCIAAVLAGFGIARAALAAGS